MTIKGSWFRRPVNLSQLSTTETDLTSVLLPSRANTLYRLRGYRFSLVIDSIAYSTTSTWEINIALSTERENWGDWTFDTRAPADIIPARQMIDGWMTSGGNGRVVTEGGYLVVRMLHLEPVITNLIIPSAYLALRRTGGAAQTFGITGWLDYELVTATPGEMAAVNLNWGIQGVPPT